MTQSAQETYTITLRRGTTLQWVASNPVLAAGEPGFETDTGKLKIGDGLKNWTSLDYILPSSAISQMISTAVAGLGTGGGTGGGGLVSQDLIDHINSTTPHPIYDDGPSLVTVYQNAKA